MRSFNHTAHPPVTPPAARRTSTRVVLGVRAEHRHLRLRLADGRSHRSVRRLTDLVHPARGAARRSSYHGPTTLAPAADARSAPRTPASRAARRSSPRSPSSDNRPPEYFGRRRGGVSVHQPASRSPRARPAPPAVASAAPRPRTLRLVRGPLRPQQVDRVPAGQSGGCEGRPPTARARATRTPALVRPRLELVEERPPALDRDHRHPERLRQQRRPAPAPRPRSAIRGASGSAGKPARISG